MTILDSGWCSGFPEKLQGSDPGQAVLTHGKTLLLKARTCFPSHTGNPQPQITWLKDGHPLPSGDTFSVSPDGSKLHIPRASLSDAGRYSCSVANQTKDYLLDVLGMRCLWMETVSGVSRGHGLRGLSHCLPQVGGEDPLVLQPAAWHEVLDLIPRTCETSWRVQVVRDPFLMMVYGKRVYIFWFWRAALQGRV